MQISHRGNSSRVMALSGIVAAYGVGLSKGDVLVKLLE